jgi:Skp family chaperone for outer membrane proteins
MMGGKHRLLLAAMLCALAGWGACRTAGAQVAEAGDGTTKRIAVVNIARVFNACQKVKDVQDKLIKEFEGERKVLEKDDKALKDWEAKVSTDTRNPKEDIEFFREIQKLELARMEFNDRMRKLGERMEKKRKDEMKEVLNLIKISIRNVGAAEKYDLILRAPEFDDLFEGRGNTPEADQNISSAELVRRFRENPVMYYSEGVDITAKVIAKVNEGYKADEKIDAKLPK